MPRVLVAIADGSEDIEMVTVIDVLRRADIDVTVASVMPGERIHLTAARGLQVIADTHISAIQDWDYDLIYLPGGLPGAEHLRDADLLIERLRQQHADGRYIAAICAAPAVVLAAHGLLQNVRATSYPSFQAQLTGAIVEAQLPVVIDQGFITSQGVGTALVFSLEIVRRLTDGPRAQSVADAMLVAFQPMP